MNTIARTKRVKAGVGVGGRKGVCRRMESGVGDMGGNSLTTALGQF